MATIQLVFDRAAVVSGVEKWTNYSAEAILDTESGAPVNPMLVCGLSSYPASIRYKEITRAVFYLFVHAEDVLKNFLYPQAIGDPFDEDTVTFSDITITGYLCDMHYFAENSWNSKTLNIGTGFRDSIQNGVIISPSGSWRIETPKGTNKPYIEITYGLDDIGLDITPTYPVGEATISKEIATTFTWDAMPQTEATLEPVEAASAVLRWRYSGASSYTEVACDNPTQHTISANTFAEGTIQWQVVMTANSGIVATSAWTTTEVKEPVSSAVASYPVNSVIDGSMAQTFAWEHIIPNGTAQYAFELQTSPDGSEWTTIRHAVTAQTNTDFAADTFTAGDLWWRVRTYNLAGTAGAWSEAAHCIVISAPAAPSITADDTSPRFVLRWQQSGQQAYELMVDGVIIAKKYSSESIYRHDGYLNQGSHTVQVRTQNKYQMWSNWGTATLQIVNVEGSPIDLVASGSNDVTLSWSTGEKYDKYIIYRNSNKIAETSDTSYIDHFAVGKADYQVRGVYHDYGNYTMSNSVEVVIIPKTILIADVSSPAWIELPLSVASLRSIGISASQSVTYTHYVGAQLPDGEIGEAVTKNYSLDCAFKASDLESMCRFEALLGKMVCIKTPSQRRIIGIMSQMNVEENHFYVTYNVPITEVRWEEMRE